MEPDSIVVAMATEEGDLTDYDGDAAVLQLYDGTTEMDEYTGLVTGNVLTLDTTDGLPEKPGLYRALLILDATYSAEGFFECRGTPATRTAGQFDLDRLVQDLGRYPFDTSDGRLSDGDFPKWLLAAAVFLAVDDWNAHPDLSDYTPLSFPDYARLKEGASAYAFQLAGTALQRERLPATSGGVSLDSNMRTDLYFAKAAELLERYRAWIGWSADREFVIGCFGTM